MRGLVESLLLALFPPQCPGCAQVMPARHRSGLCIVCREHLVANDGTRCAHCDLPLVETGTDPALCPACLAAPPPFRSLRAPWLYGGALAHLIGAAKFHGQSGLCRHWIELMLEDEEVHRLVHSSDAIVPVPLGRQRARQRGYNQSAIISRMLSERLQRPTLHLLHRSRETRPQTLLDRDERLANLAGAFALNRQGRRPVPKRLLLVDDVVTSTITVRQAAQTLGTATTAVGGPVEIRVLALARASSTHDGPEG